MRLGVYLGSLVRVGNFQRFHRLDHNEYSLYGISEDERFEFSPVSITVALTVDDPHLLDEGTLASLTRPCVCVSVCVVCVGGGGGGGGE